MTDIKIEKNVPVLNNWKGNGNKKAKYPFREMEIGDSFYTDKKNIRNTSHQFGTRNNMKFTVRKDGDGFRCWRTA